MSASVIKKSHKFFSHDQNIAEDSLFDHEDPAW